MRHGKTCARASPSVADRALNRKVRVEPEASAELEEAILWYDKQHVGLGTEFLHAVDQAIVHVERWPGAAPLVHRVGKDIPARRAPVPRFPYGIVYLMVDETIRILAFAQDRRKPNYWQVRTSASE